MYSATEYRRVRVVFLAKDFPDTSCRIDFLRRRTLDEGLNRGFNQKVDRRCAVVALIVVTALGSTSCQSATEYFVAGNNLECTQQ